MKLLIMHIYQASCYILRLMSISNYVVSSLSCDQFRLGEILSFVVIGPMKRLIANDTLQTGELSSSYRYDAVTLTVTDSTFSTAGLLDVSVFYAVPNSLTQNNFLAFFLLHCIANLFYSIKERNASTN